MDGIEQYSLPTVFKMQEAYTEFVKESGIDPDFPNLNFGDKGTSLVSSNSNNLFTALDGDEEAIRDYNQGDMAGLTLNLSK